jgi:cell division protein FtsL
MRSPAASVYRIFKRAGEAAPSVRTIVIALVVTASLVTAIGVVRVERHHEVLELGYRLARTSEHVREQRETRRRLELEYATSSAPDRIRRLATALGMTSVAPDRIRVVDVPAHPKVAATLPDERRR